MLLSLVVLPVVAGLPTFTDLRAYLNEGSLWPDVAILSNPADTDLGNAFDSERSGDPLATVLSQPSAHRAPVQPHYKLTWGDLNFLHTTDTHGWLAGHILESEFSGDWGDFVSFRTHMRELAHSKGYDLILVDTGDRHDGNGLSDASDPVNLYTFPLFAAGDHDIITTGNHELYKSTNTIAEFLDAKERYGERYVVSNVEVYYDQKWVDLGYKFRFFETPVQGLRVLALGFLFNFDGNDKSTSRVTRVEDEIQKPWFQALLHNEIAGNGVDVVVVAGHIPVRESPEFQALFDAIRDVNPLIEIAMFGGHSHIRDFKIYDGHAAALESGRFLETLGWASINITRSEELGSASTTPSSSFERTYIDFNRDALAFHAEKVETEFDTDEGIEVSRQIANSRKALKLDDLRSCVPSTYYTDRRPFPHKASIFSLLQDHVLPLLTAKRDVPRWVLLNTGAIRFDLFSGRYTKDTGFIVSPFQNEWVYIKDVPLEVAQRVLQMINGEDKVAFGSRARNGRQRLGRSIEPQNALRGSKLLSGYYTKDDYGYDGDDTPHKPWKFYSLPNVIHAAQNVTAATSEIDLVFHDFLAPWVLHALRLLDSAAYKVEPHGGEQLIDLIPQYLETLGTKC